MMQDDRKSGNTFPHLTDAPATEAIIFIAFKPTRFATLDAIHKFQHKMANTFPFSTPILTHNNRIQVLNDKPSYTQHVEQQGVQLENQEQRLIAKIGLDSLFLSKLKPYTDGTDLISNYKSLFERYLELLQPENIQHISMRYINQFDVEADSADKYLNYLPGLNFYDSKTVYGGENLFRTVMADENNCRAYYTQLIRPIKKNNEMYLNVTIDIDAHKQGFIDSDWDSLNAVMSQLRYFKNNIFFASITPECVKLFKPS